MKLFLVEEASAFSRPEIMGVFYIILLKQVIKGYIFFFVASTRYPGFRSD